MRRQPLQEVARRVDGQRNERRRPECSRWGGRTSPDQELADRGLLQDLAVGDLRLGDLQALLRLRVAQELKGCLDRFEVLCGDEHDVLAPVLGDLDTLM